MFSKEKQLVSWFIIGLLIAVMAGLLVCHWYIRQSGQKPEVVYTTPQEVIDAYGIAMTDLRDQLVTSTLSYEQSAQKAEDVFLSVRVPEGERDHHLKTFLQLKSVTTTADIVGLIETLLKK